MDNKMLLQEVIDTIESKKINIKRKMLETEVFVNTEKENILILKNIQYSVEQIQKGIDEKENPKTEGTTELAKCVDCVNYLSQCECNDGREVSDYGVKFNCDGFENRKVKGE